MSPSASLQLFCLPYSGASAVLYNRWQSRLPAWIRLQPLELPGRGLRFAEALHNDAASLVAQLAGELPGLFENATPYAFFGHSLGGLLAFELAHAMRRRGLEEPLALFLSGVSAPAENDLSAYRRAREDAELVAALRDYRGTPEAVFNDPSLMQMLLPVVRADFLVTGSYRYQLRAPLAAALHVFGGREDRLRSAELLGWLREAGGEFSLDLLDGQHFFIREQEAQLLRHLRRYAGQHLLRWRQERVRESLRAAS
ncbi:MULTISPECIES: thioesterase II family protein [Pseudomonas aeruginosa group]|uniref:thioesterase II family protein n=1 Tax=Pseudomonas aeruginosa group TaxID=136841 RepID=UPI00071C0319|nr:MULTISPECIES: thioesterase domain-containing protein [Pseudomonas aeruginosa group]KSC42368.1 thioesterase [Pseudomonas paraeruginosa]KSL09356.1 thioesterase [Pseudomonas aeruginosa]MBH8714036.1 thioesterase [Pseudomonas aeruginosa]MBH9395161.1 thioesterase [Pseudomonas aeruginosa]MBI8118007.1 thioesterase [Pseudomonas aeruginosa]